jgi:hypothetical protein
MRSLARSSNAGIESEAVRQTSILLRVKLHEVAYPVSHYFVILTCEKYHTDKSKNNSLGCFHSIETVDISYLIQTVAQ